MIWECNSGTSFGGHEAIIKVLLGKGAEVNAQEGHFGNSPQAPLFT